MGDLMNTIDRIFYPRAISLIGSSNRQGSFGRVMLEGFIQMGCQNLYPVHPREKELLGLKAYASIQEIPVDIDLAISLVPQSEVVKVVRECAAKGVKNLLLFAAGFREKDQQGLAIEQEIVRIARQGNMGIIGPNANGFYSPASRMCTFPGCLMSGGLPLESGKLSMFSQSGSFNDFLCQIITKKNIRFSKVVGCGNEADLGAADFLEYFGSDPETKVIACYLEGIRDGRRFFELARRISKAKPIIIWKGGRTEQGAQAARAHTGVLAGSQLVWEAMFKQAGLISVSSLEQMTDCILAFTNAPLPKGKRVAILSGMAGTNVGTADNCLIMGLEMAKFSPETNEKLFRIIPAAGTAVANPLDIGVGALVNPGLYGETARILLADENVDMLIPIVTPNTPSTIQDLAEVIRDTSKPVIISLYDIQGLVEPQMKFLQEQHIPALTDPKRAAFVLSKMAEYVEYRDRP